MRSPNEYLYIVRTASCAHIRQYETREGAFQDYVEIFGREIQQRGHLCHSRLMDVQALHVEFRSDLHRCINYRH